jgi:hypothetical protein
LAHAIGASQIGLHSAFHESLNGFFPLMGGRLQRAAKSYATGLRSRAAIISRPREPLSVMRGARLAPEFVAAAAAAAVMVFDAVGFSPLQFSVPKGTGETGDWRNTSDLGGDWFSSFSSLSPVTGG